MFAQILVFAPILIAFVLRNPLKQDDIFSKHENSAEESPVKVLLVTAHPDDESLFFAPTLISLLSHKHTGGIKNAGQWAEVYSLCLSTGDSDGLGEIRKQELAGSLDVLGIEEGKRWIVDNPNLRDNITVTWDPQIIADVVKPYILGYEIDVILTFDNEGISSHPNHKSIPIGLKHLLSSRLSQPPKLYTLISLPPFVKYQGPLAPILAKYDLFVQRVWQDIYPYVFGNSLDVGRDKQPMVPVFISGVQEYLKALKSMQQHQSQLVWFRYLYVVASRYMWVNEWLEVKVSTA